MKKRAAGRLLALLALLFIGLFASHSPLVPAASPVRASSPLQTTVLVTTPSGSNHTDDLSGNLKTVTFDVNVSAAPSIDNFFVVLQYNTTLFSVNKVDYAGNVLGPDANVVVFCIDNKNQVQIGGSCLATDADGVITLNLSVQGTALTPPLTNGLLFSVTLNILTSGLGQLHISQAHLIGIIQTTSGGTALGDVPVTSTIDGYYTNMACPQGSGIACRPPLVTIKVTPLAPSQGSLVSFNTTVLEYNANAKVKSYLWDWGDGSVSQVQTNLTKLETHTFDVLLGLSSNCVNLKACPVTLTIVDSPSMNWKTTIVVHLIHLFIHLSIGGVQIDHQSSVVPGTLVHITADIINYSLIAENATLTVSLEQTKLKAGSFSLAAPGTSGASTTGSLSAVWDTSDYAPRAYAIVVRINDTVSAQPVGGSLIRTENSTSNNVATNYVILIVPQTLGALSLSLIQTTGLGILIVAAVVFGVTRFLKKPSYESEPL